MNERFGNYLMQPNKIIHDLFAINQVQQLVMNRISNPRRRKGLTFAFVVGLWGCAGQNACVKGGRCSNQHAIFDASKIALSTEWFLCLDTPLRTLPRLPGTAILPWNQQCHRRSGVALPAALGRCEASITAWHGEAGIDVMVIVVDLPTEKKWSTDVAV